YAQLRHSPIHDLYPHPSPFTTPATPDLSTLSLHDALPILPAQLEAPRRRLEGLRVHQPRAAARELAFAPPRKRLVEILACQQSRSEEHTSEFQSRFDLVCRLLLEKKNR